MVTVVQNVTRDMREISCYADNGYGTPMQASRTITISREYWWLDFSPHTEAAAWIYRSACLFCYQFDYCG